MPKTAIAAAVIALVLGAAPAQAQDRGIELGTLECAISGGTGFIFGSSKDLSCTFTPADKTFAPEAYFGAVNKYGLKPKAIIVDSQWAGLDPGIMGFGPVLSSTELLKRNKLKLQDVETWEINEAFASQLLGCLAAWNDDKFCREVLGLDGAAGQIDPAKLNVDGGAISLGHPVGTSGNRIVLHLVNAMKRLGTKRGIATECIGGGLGGAMLIETV